MAELTKALGVATVAFLIAGPAAVAADAGSEAKGHVIVIENMRFDPQTLTVSAGERITWVNKDLFPHTATSEAGAFTSHAIAPNASWTLIAAKPGKYSYACTYHPAMKATLTVQ